EPPFLLPGALDKVENALAWGVTSLQFEHQSHEHLDSRALPRFLTNHFPRGARPDQSVRGSRRPDHRSRRGRYDGTEVPRSLSCRRDACTAKSGANRVVLEPLPTRRATPDVRRPIPQTGD